MTIRILVLVLLPSLTVLAQTRPATSGLKVLLVESEAAAKDGKGLAQQLGAAGPLQVRSVKPGKLSDDDLEWAQVITVTAELTEKDEAWILKAGRSGKGLVLCADAIGSLPDSGNFATLTGRVSLGPQQQKNTPIAVAFPDQRGEVTQSLTHFWHEDRLREYKLDKKKTQLLAYALRATAQAEVADKGKPRHFPVVWTMSSGFFNRGPYRSRVFICTLDPLSGPSRGMVMTLLARAAEWTAHRRVTSWLKGEYTLMSEKLGAGENGLLKGLAGGREYYRGRQIAPVMGYQGADWLIRPEREQNEQPEKVLDVLKLEKGQTVCDFGAGNGYFSLKMARRVGSEGKVLCVDIQPQMLELLRRRARAQKVTNIEPILCTETDPKLPANSIDLLIMVDVYHEISNPIPVMAGIHKAMKKDGRVVLVEYRGEDPSIPIKPLHRTTVKQMASELDAVGFRYVANKGDFLPRQHILIYKKK